MTGIPDTLARLSEGLAAVDDLQLYVSACGRRGYAHPDLTAHPDQVRYWYGAHDGLDIRLLDADTTALRTAARDSSAGLDTLRAMITDIEVVWRGSGGAAALGFLARHSDNVDRLTQNLHTAAGAYDTLRDELWAIVDRHVSGTAAVGDRTQPIPWRTAAHTALGAGVVSEEMATIVDEQIAPFVNNVVATEWLTLMRRSAEEANAAYRRAVEVISGCPAVHFELPGELDIGRQPAVAHATSAPAMSPVAASPVPPPAAATPAGSVPVAAEPAPPTLPAAAPTVPAAALDPGMGALGSMPSLPTMPSFDGLGGPSGLGGTGHSGGLPDAPKLPEPDIPELGGESDAAPDSDPDEEEPNPEDPESEPDPEEPDPDPDPDPDPPEPEDPDAEPDPEESGPDEHQEPAEAPIAAPDCPPPPALPPAPSPAPPGSPCEIAADELPQAGQ